MGRVVEFDKPQDTGRKGYLEADEPWDGSDRPRVKIVEPFWKDKNEELDYLFAVEETRGITLPSERRDAICARFSKGQAVKRMPSARMGRRQTDNRLAELREQEELI